MPISKNVLRDVSEVKRVIIKIGTNLLSDGTGINRQFMEKIVLQIYNLREMGLEILIVSSGAIGMGAVELGFTERVKAIPMRQACASIGQPLVMQHYRDMFRKYGVTISQILLTREVLNNRMSYLNLRNSIETLLGLGVIPIINENDSVSTAEIGTAFGDNDTLSALIASKTDADLLIILTDIDGLYDKDPSKHEDAQLVPYIQTITDEIKSWAGSGSGSTFSTGGMKTKLEAAQIAAGAGCASIIANGDEDSVLNRLLAGDDIGTYFSSSSRLPQRFRWIMHTQSEGTIKVDEGAIKALRNKKSLLPVGVTEVVGIFDAGAVVMINDDAKAVTSMNSEQIRNLIGYRSSEIHKKTGDSKSTLIARPEDIIFLR